MTERATTDLQAVQDALSIAATLGTERRPFRAAHAAGVLGAALAQLDPATGSEYALLSAAAMLSSYQRAGYQAPQAPEAAMLVPAPDDAAPICSSAASQHLHTMLGGTHRAVLPEWLKLLAASGKRVPGYLLPDLLEAGRQTPELRPFIRAAVGLLGQWLAVQNPDWHYASVAAASTSPISLEQARALWETGTRLMRLALLEELRSRTPAAARELVESTWTSEKADDRSAFLEKLRIGLSMDDEPLLESALDDRSKEVRKTAAELLSRLPQSRLVQRMIARVMPLLRWVPPEGKRLLGLVQGKPGKLEVTVPETCDKDMVRDGVDEKPAVSGQSIGERAQWLRQMLHAIPPSYWAAQWQATAQEVMAAVNAQIEWSSVLIWAFTEAAQASADTEWAEAILRIEPERFTLLPVLSIERQEAVLIQLLEDKKVVKTPDTLFTLLRLTTHQWSIDLARAVLGMLIQHFARPPDRLRYMLTHALNEAAYHIPPTMLHEIETVSTEWHNAPEYWLQASENMLYIVRFRHDMQEALRA